MLPPVVVMVHVANEDLNKERHNQGSTFES